MKENWTPAPRLHGDMLSGGDKFLLLLITVHSMDNPKYRHGPVLTMSCITAGYFVMLLYMITGIVSCHLVVTLIFMPVFTHEFNLLEEKGGN